MIRIGLTGGIGSGKSTVLQTLADCGAAVVDADAIARSVTAPGGRAIVAIARHFGADFITPDGALDRARMRDRVYADPGARRELEAIVHPLVGAETARQADEAARQGHACVVFDVPLLVESGRWRQRVDKVMVVDCHPDTQVARVVTRSGLAPEQVRAIMAAQADRRTRLAAADLVICNEGLTLDGLRHLVVEAARTFGL